MHTSRNYFIYLFIECPNSSNNLTYLHYKSYTIHSLVLNILTILLILFQIKLSNISGYSTFKSKLHEAVSLTPKHGSIFKRCGFSPHSRFLFFGPPGCGQSILVSALATEFHLNVISVKRLKYFGESEQNLARIFQQVTIL